MGALVRFASVERIQVRIEDKRRFTPRPRVIDALISFLPQRHIFGLSPTVFQLGQISFSNAWNDEFRVSDLARRKVKETRPVYVCLRERSYVCIYWRVCAHT